MARHRALTQINIFTDGSRKDEQTGAGFVIYDNARQELARGSLRLPDHATVFQAEVVAISAAIQALQELCLPSIRYVKFFVDSQAALRAVANPVISSVIVGNAVDALNILSGVANRVSLSWIPSHRAFFGNTLADDLAKTGTTTSGPPYPVGKSTASVSYTHLTLPTTPYV